MNDVLIIGGGISGLATAWWLTQHGIEAEVWERDDRPGGKIRSTREAGYLTERAAGILVNHRPEIDRLISQAGLHTEKRTRRADLPRHVVQRGALQEVPMQLSRLALSPLWSRWSKLRLLGELLIPHASKHESVSEFVTRRLGSEILETALEPFVAATLACDPDQADARAVLPRLTELEQRYGSLTAGILINRVIKRHRINQSESFSFVGGMSQLIETLAANPGIRWRAGHVAQEISPERDGWRVSARTACGDRTVQVRQLVLCTPADTAAKLTAPLGQALGGLLNGIEYVPLAVVHLGLSQTSIAHSLHGSGFLVPRREQLNLNGNLWMSSLFPNRAPTDKVLLSSYLGGSRHPEHCDWDDTRLVDGVCADLGRLIGLRGTPDYVRIDRHAQALPLYHGRYRERLDEITHRLNAWPGLHLCANYIGGASVRERIFHGLQTANAIAATLAEEQDALSQATGHAVVGFHCRSTQPTN